MEKDNAKKTNLENYFHFHHDLWYQLSHSSTNQAWLCLTSKIRRDGMCSERYGHRQSFHFVEGIDINKDSNNERILNLRHREEN